MDDMQAPLPPGRYSVLQTTEEIVDKLTEVILKRNPVEVDLVTDDGLYQLQFRLRTTDHDAQGAVIYGVTFDHRSIKLNLPDFGEVTAIIDD